MAAEFVDEEAVAASRARPSDREEKEHASEHQDAPHGDPEHARPPLAVDEHVQSPIGDAVHRNEDGDEDDRTHDAEVAVPSGAANRSELPPHFVGVGRSERCQMR